MKTLKISAILHGRQNLVPRLFSTQWRSQEQYCIVYNTALFLSAFSALVHLNSCIELVILRRIALKKRKRALLAMIMSTVARKQAMTRGVVGNSVTGNAPSHPMGVITNRK